MSAEGAIHSTNRQGGEKEESLSQVQCGAYWQGMVEHFSRPDFLAALYDYLTSIDVSAYDFKVERTQVLTESYRRMVEANVSYEARFLVHLLRRMLSESCTVDDGGDLVFFTPPGGASLRPSGVIKVKRSVVYQAYMVFVTEFKQTPRTNHLLYKRLRELKLRISECKVGNSCAAFVFDLDELYQECIQRGYENPKFALPGFQQKDEILDHRPFSVSEFLD